MILTPTYSSNPNSLVMNTMPCQQFFGINAAIDHKSETQLQGWKNLIERMYKVYNKSPLGQRKPLNSLEFPQFVMGMNTDHAEDQKKLVQLFQTWKAMHKEMNSVKGGNTHMMAFWVQNGLVAPMKLHNCDNSAAASLGGSETCTRAAEVLQAGSVKLTSLVGAVFSHKDKKEGLQDSLQVYLQSVVGYMVCFPGTSSMTQFDL